ncbi:phytanoyl-CoA dioxygenase family protein [Rubripirellula sp.]|nr:phytanoyl-CoA dioxygenase family protein [Rubripirellula sp.]MDB4339030.1 phytanoyl-CoA dioxygenase family protein [Rubripirellula sp.]
MEKNNLQHQKRVLDEQGFCLLPECLEVTLADKILAACQKSFESERKSKLTSSSRGHIYAARNLIRSVPLVKEFWQHGSLRVFLNSCLGAKFGLVRVLYFDKPPKRTWALAWHKDTAIPVREHLEQSRHFTRPTTKAGVPHVIASDTILRSMVTLRVHLDEVIDDNGPLKVIPQSHLSNDCLGLGEENAHTVLAKKGEVLAMRPLITHGSAASKPGTQLHRRILHLEYASDKTLPDNYQWHDFVNASDKK